MSTTPTIDYSFTPESYGDDPLEELFSAIESDEVRGEAWRLLGEDRFDELTELLKKTRVLKRNGRINHNHFDFSFEEDDIQELGQEDDGIYVANMPSPSADLGSAWVRVRRVGWYWVFEHAGEFDGPEIDQATEPLALGDLISMLDSTDYRDHFASMSEWDEVLVWESKVYPQLEVHYQLEEAARIEEERASHEDDDE